MDTVELRDLRRSQLSKQLYENAIVLGHAGITLEERSAVEAENQVLLVKLGQDRPVRFGPQRPPEAYRPSQIAPISVPQVPYIDPRLRIFLEDKCPIFGKCFVRESDLPLHVEFPTYWNGQRIPTKSERIADLKKAYYNSPLNSPERAALKKRIEAAGGSVE